MKRIEKDQKVQGGRRPGRTALSLAVLLLALLLCCLFTSCDSGSSGSGGNAASTSTKQQSKQQDTLEDGFSNINQGNKCIFLDREMPSDRAMKRKYQFYRKAMANFAKVPKKLRKEAESQIESYHELNQYSGYEGKWQAHADGTIYTLDIFRETTYVKKDGKFIFIFNYMMQPANGGYTSREKGSIRTLSDESISSKKSTFELQKNGKLRVTTGSKVKVFHKTLKVDPGTK
ncbi:MAG: hypothetical protein ACOYJJ_01565 [Anaerovoracaceae bacterium]|jgi:hypothetical protein